MAGGMCIGSVFALSEAGVGGGVGACGCAVNPPMIVCGRFSAGSDFVGGVSGGGTGGAGRGSFDFDDGGGDGGSAGARPVGRGIKGRGAIAPPSLALTPPRFDDGGSGALAARASRFASLSGSRRVTASFSSGFVSGTRVAGGGGSLTDGIGNRGSSKLSSASIAISLTFAGFVGTSSGIDCAGSRASVLSFVSARSISDIGGAGTE